jgi:hypothetical protein
VKYEKHQDGVHTTIQGETPVEFGAIEWIKKNVPIFAGSESYGVSGFLAGAKWQAERLASEDDGQMRDLRLSLFPLPVETVAEVVEVELTVKDREDLIRLLQAGLPKD